MLHVSYEVMYHKMIYVVLLYELDVLHVACAVRIRARIRT